MKMFEKIGQYLGYSVYTNLPLHDYYYLPSNLSGDIFSASGFVSNGRGTQKGIPNTEDYGYMLSEFMDLIKRLFNGKFAILNNTLYFLNADDDFWVRTSSYKLREDTFIPVTEYNNQDLKANTLYSFRTDVTDSYTITEYKGTSYQIITRPIVTNNQSNVLLKGLDRVEFPVALGTIKSKLNAFDNVLLRVSIVMDSLSRVFGGSSNYASLVRGRSNMLKLSDNNYTIPKILYIKGNSIPSRHRDFLSAKFFYENYHINKSFVSNNFYGQKKIYTGIRVPFSYDDWIKITNNSYFTDYKGNVAKITQLKWSVGGDYAEIDFWVREPYTKNLTEDFIEPQ
jgi:hypothetical protein